MSIFNSISEKDLISKEFNIQLNADFSICEKCPHYDSYNKTYCLDVHLAEQHCFIASDLITIIQELKFKFPVPYVCPFYLEQILFQEKHEN